ncbi:MAG: extracellular solute-binding protein [Ruminiclostridium sp.]|nr:extracellular solute-binding protein [Ruminiclostridium sp.]
MKIRKTAAFALAAVIAAVSGCGGAPGDTQEKKEIRVWTTIGTKDVTQNKLNEWLGTQDEWNTKYTITVSAMGTGEVVTQFLTDTEEGADVFNFAQDQLSRLVAVNALSAPGGVFLENIVANNDEGSVQAATQDGKVYAYPETSDNGYFMYYDTSVVSDPSTLEGILEQCQAAGKKFFYPMQEGWYTVSFLFGTGTECSYTCGSDGTFTDARCSFDSDAGLAAFKAMTAMCSHPAYALSTGTDAAFFNPDGGTAGAVVSVPAEAAVARKMLGDNYGAAPLPTFTVDGVTYQMGGFKGYKLIGVKPHNDGDTTVFCHAVADYLSGEEMQLARYEADGWGPSNLKLQQTDTIKSDKALSALSVQFGYCTEQGQFPNVFWDLMKAFGSDINSGKYNGASDEEMRAALAGLQNDLLKAR